MMLPATASRGELSVAALPDRKAERQLDRKQREAGPGVSRAATGGWLRWSGTHTVPPTTFGV